MVIHPTIPPFPTWSILVNPDLVVQLTNMPPSLKPFQITWDWFVAFMYLSFEPVNSNSVTVLATRKWRLEGSSD